jgi:protein-tyrosine phosphatase
MEPMRILFVCTGNICRSPLAEAVFRQHVQAAGLSKSFEIDSAATHDYHTGEPADPRARRVGERHGAEVTSRARPVEDADFARFDRIVAMDRGHLRWLRARCPAALRERILLMRDYEAAATPGSLDVPDPYYDDIAAFERVYAMLDVCCGGLLASLRA